MKLRSLSDVSIHKVLTDPPSPTTFIIFQKDCSACRKQIENLDCLKKKTKVVLVGMFSSENELRSEFKKFNSDWVGLYGGDDFKKAFKIRTNLTPQIIIAQEGKHLFIHGLTSCRKIASKILLKEEI